MLKYTLLSPLIQNILENILLSFPKGPFGSSVLEGRGEEERGDF